MKSMKQVFGVMVMLIVALVAVELNATQTRLTGLGINRWMVTDDDNIWLNPAYITNYSNRVWIEYFPAAALQSGGITIPQGGISPFVHGIFIGRTYNGNIANVGVNAANSDVTAVASAITPGITNATAGLGNLSTLAPTNKFDYILGVSPILGVAFNFANGLASNSNVYNSDPKTTNDGTADNVRNSNEFNVRLGLLLDKFFNFGKTDLVLQVTLPLVNNKYTEQRYMTAQSSNATDTRELTSTGTELLVLVRPEKVIDKNNKLYSIAQYQFSSLPSKYTDKEDTNADNTLDVNTEQLRNRLTHTALLGMAMNTALGEKTLLVYGISANMFLQSNREKTVNKIGDTTTQEYNYDYLMWNIPVNLALEHKISKKFVARTGIQKVLYQFTQATPNDPDWANNAVVSTNKTVTGQHTTGNVAASLGLTYVPTDNLTLEAVVAQDILYCGPYIISGQTRINNMFTQLSLLYKFR